MRFLGVKWNRELDNYQRVTYKAQPCGTRYIG